MNKEENKISVIIPTYNRASYLAEAIDSVLEQTHPVDEIVVIDDGSTDDTRNIVNQYGYIVKYFRQGNRGPAAARNKGLKVATGDYISFIDDDDLWVPDKIESQLDFFKKYSHIDILFGHHANFSSPSDSIQPEILNQVVYEYFRDNFNNLTEAFKYLIVENIISTPSVMFKKQCLKRVAFFDVNLRCAEDYEYWLRFAYHCNMGFMDRVLVKRRIHNDNLIHDYLVRLNSHLKVLESLNSKYPDLPNSVQSEIKKSIKRTCFQLGSYYFKLKDYNYAFDLLRRAVPEYFLNWKFTVKLCWSLLNK